MVDHQDWAYLLERANDVDPEARRDAVDAAAWHIRYLLIENGHDTSSHVLTPEAIRLAFSETLRPIPFGIERACDILANVYVTPPRQPDAVAAVGVLKAVYEVLTREEVSAPLTEGPDDLLVTNENWARIQILAASNDPGHRVVAVLASQLINERLLKRVPEYAAAFKSTDKNRSSWTAVAELAARECGFSTPTTLEFAIKVRNGLAHEEPYVALPVAREVVAAHLKLYQSLAPAMRDRDAAILRAAQVREAEAAAHRARVARVQLEHTSEARQSRYSRSPSEKSWLDHVVEAIVVVWILAVQTGIGPVVGGGCLLVFVGVGGALALFGGGGVLAALASVWAFLR